MATGNIPDQLKGHVGHAYFKHPVFSENQIQLTCPYKNMTYHFSFFNSLRQLEVEHTFAVVAFRRRKRESA